MSPVQGRSRERNDSNGPGPDGPGLDDCRMLITRIDGTMAALRRERERLVARAGRLTSEPDAAGKVSRAR